MEDSWKFGEPVSSVPAEIPRYTELIGRLVSLVSIDPERHGSDLFEATHGDAAEPLWRYMLDSPPDSLAAFKKLLGDYASSVDRVCFAILDKASGVAVGTASYISIHPADRTIEVGSVLFTQALQRTAGGTEAMYLMARHAFEDLRYRRYEWKCNSLNQASKRAALRYGFHYEGTFRQHMIVKGRNRDTAWFSMLDSEWLMRKKAFQQWLDSSNFDASGRQKQSLSAISLE